MKTITDALEVSRSNQYGRKKARTRYRKPDDEKYLSLIKNLADQRPTWGYRRVCALLNRRLVNEGQPRVNHKRVYRLMKMHHLLLQKHTGRPIRLHEGAVITLKSNMRWCSDMFEIPSWNGEKVRVVFALDCSDREVLSYVATTGGISGEMVRDLMALAIENRFGSESISHIIQWLSDNGPAYTAYETQSFARLMGLEPRTTPSYSPESNGMAESFIKTFKRDYVAMHNLDTAERVMEQLPSWFEDYNEYHPHKGLKMKSPREYRRSLAKLEGCPV
jgi:transposase InsO family protein